MNIIARYRALAIWNKLGAVGSIASIVSIPLALILTAFPIWYAARTPPEISTKRKAPIVTFTDGKHASIGFGFITHIEKEDAITVFKMVGSADKAREFVVPSVASALIAELEKRTMSQARQNRLEIERDLQVRLRPEFTRVGLTLDAISINEIDEL